MRYQRFLVAAAGLTALALTFSAGAQDKAPDRPADGEKVKRVQFPRRDGEPQRDGEPRREGDSRRDSDPRPEKGKAFDGPPPPPRGMPGGFGGGGGFRGGEGYGGPFGGGMSGMSGFGGGYAAPPDDPEMRELIRKDSDMERQTAELAAQFRRAGGEERDKLKTQVAEIVANHFDVRQERRKLQLKRMEEELKRLREAITKRDDATDSIVKNRIAELIGEPRELDF